MAAEIIRSFLVHTTLPDRPEGGLFTGRSTATSYYATILIIVSITVTTTEFEAGGGVDDTPVEGISPAITVAESAQASAAANIKRFILFFLCD
jgi:hypothetical protein